MRNIQEVIAESDGFVDQNDIHHNFAVLHHAVDKDGLVDPELDWRLARAYFLLSQETEDKRKREELIVKGCEIAQKAVVANPEQFAAHAWYGILLGRKGDFVSIKKKIANAYVIRDAFIKALELNPKDPVSLHCYGVWHWQVLQVGALERGIASVMFGKPPTTTYEECEKCLLASAKIDDGQVFNNLMLGDLYHHQKKLAEAKAWYEKAAACPVATEAQARMHKEAVKKATKWV